MSGSGNKDTERGGQGDAEGEGRPPLIGLRHAALFSPDLAAAERFWTDVMGFTIEWRPDDDNVYLSSGADNLALHRAPAGAVTGDFASAPQRLDHIGLAVPSPDGVDVWAGYLRRRGVALTAEPKTHRDGSRSLYLRTPDGVLVQIIYHRPLSQ
jgi:catechol 2,3-dioxygenase-like lactoylglutathione lyase family enzyme